MIDVVRGLDAEDDQHFVAHGDAGIDAGDLAERELRRATVLLHVEAEQRVHVVEHAVVVRVAVDLATRLAVAVVGRRRVQDVERAGQRDRGVDGVVPAAEIDRLERVQRSHLIGERPTVEAAGLQRWIADHGIVAVREHVVVAQEEELRGIAHGNGSRAERARGDRRMPDRIAHRRWTQERRRIAEGHDHPAHSEIHGYSIQRRRNRPWGVVHHVDLDGGPSVGEEPDGGADHTLDAHQRGGVALLGGDRLANILCAQGAETCLLVVGGGDAAAEIGAAGKQSGAENGRHDDHGARGEAEHDSSGWS